MCFYDTLLARSLHVIHLLCSTVPRCIGFLQHSRGEVNSRRGTVFRNICFARSRPRRNKDSKVVHLLFQLCSSWMWAYLAKKNIVSYKLRVDESWFKQEFVWELFWLSLLLVKQRWKLIDESWWKLADKSLYKSCFDFPCSWSNKDESWWELMKVGREEFV